MLRAREVNALKQTNLPQKEKKVDIRYLNELDLVDEEARKILNTKLEEAKNQFDKAIADHLKYERSLLQQIVKLKNMETKYFQIMGMPMEDILKLLSTFEQNSQVTQTEAGRKAAEEFKKELRRIHNEWEIKLQNAVEQPQKEIELLREELDDVKREYSSAKIQWEQKLDSTVHEITEKLQKHHKETLHNLKDTSIDLEQSKCVSVNVVLGEKDPTKVIETLKEKLKVLEYEYAVEVETHNLDKAELERK